tara:strand:- start:708 stop:1094 length:387 start_codon:yes stop_codon:yes gene_type:complete
LLLIDKPTPKNRLLEIQSNDVKALIILVRRARAAFLVFSNSLRSIICLTIAGHPIKHTINPIMIPEETENNKGKPKMKELLKPEISPTINPTPNGLSYIGKKGDRIDLLIALFLSWADEIISILSIVI